MVAAAAAVTGAVAREREVAEVRSRLGQLKAVEVGGVGSGVWDLYPSGADADGGYDPSPGNAPAVARAVQAGGAAVVAWSNFQRMFRIGAREAEDLRGADAGYGVAFVVLPRI